MQGSGAPKGASQVPEQRSSDQVFDTGTNRELSLGEAAQLFDLSLSTLRRLVAVGGIAAHKVSGARGREWRVSTSTLREAGYLPRVIDLTDAHSGSDIRRLTEALIAERARNSELDGRLGYALLTVGRLRGRLREAGIDPDGLFGADLGVGPKAGR